MNACSASTSQVPLGCTAMMSSTSGRLQNRSDMAVPSLACPSSRSLPQTNCCKPRGPSTVSAAEASLKCSQLVIPGHTSSNHSIFGTFRRSQFKTATCKKHTTRLSSKERHPIRAAASNGRGDPPEKKKPRNKVAVEPTLGDRVMAATTKLLNVTAYPLGIAGLVVVLPAVWGVRLYKALTIEPLDMKDKVVVVTGASSGIGEHMAYEYARLGARLGLVARRGEKLEEVAEEARLMGAPDVLVIEQDLGNEEGCKAAVDAALAHFKTIDTLALNAGVFHAYLFTDATDTKRFDSIMDVNFWGYVYMTYHALEHLQKSRGQIVVNSSVSSIVPQPRNSIYNASKAAVTNFFHTLRIELGDSVPISIFSPGVTKSELSDGKMSQTEGKVPGPEKARDLRNEQLGLYPIVPTAMMARDAVKAARYKKHDIILPVWYNMLGVYRALAPEVLDVGLRLWIVQDPPMAKRVIDTFNIKVGQPTKDQYEAGGFPKKDKSEEDKSEEKQREKAGSRR